MPEVPSGQSTVSEPVVCLLGPAVHWRVALPKRNDLADLYCFEFHPSDTAERIFETLRDVYNRDMSTRLARFFHFSIFLRKIVIETAGFETVSSLSLHVLHLLLLYSIHAAYSPALVRQIDTTELESQFAQVKVHLMTSSVSLLFTNAFHNPTLFRRPNFASSYPQFSVANSIADEGVQTLVIRLVADKSRIFWATVALLLAAPIVGALIGMFSGRADVGVGVSAAIFSFVTCFQACVHR
jgi:hypothetical protein